MIRQHRGALRSTLFFLLLAPLLLAQLQDDLPPVAVVSSDDPSLGHPHDGIDPPTDLVDICAPLWQAQDLLATLKPSVHAHLDKKLGGAVTPSRGWGDGLGWGHEGPLSTAFRLLPRFLNFLSPATLLSKIPFIPDPAKNRRGNVISRTRKDRVDRIRQLLDDAEQNGCSAVHKTRGDMAMFPPKGFSQDLATAYASYKRMQELHADPESQFMVGFFHATGLGGVEQDQGKALLYYTFAAIQGHRPAAMAMGYRHWAGISVQEDCMTGLQWYETASASSYNNFLSGPPGGRTLPLAPARLSDKFGGIYGPHASWASTGANSQRPSIRASSAVARGETEKEILEYYQYHSDRDAHVYTVRLGRLFYLGSVYPNPGGISSGAESVGEIPQSYSKAREYFTKVARVMWPVDWDSQGNVAPKRRMSKEMEDTVREPAMVAAAFLGRMALRGEGQRQDVRRARMWYERAAELGDREAHNGLGIMYRDGLDVPTDLQKAYGYFQAAAGQDLAEAQVALGKIHLERGELQQAHQFFEVALRHGSPFEAFHLASTIHAHTARSPPQQGGRPGMCGVALAFAKVASEKGSWKEDFLSEADRAWARGEEGKAMVGWMIAAEMGYEIGQNNVAFLLDKGWSSPGWEHVNGKERALGLWIRSAGQDNVDAMVKVGDYFYHNASRPLLDVASAVGEEDYERAASYYQTAAEFHTSSMAYWNLGYMYENGEGVPRDWHLAKRHYDLALEVSEEAYLPVMLSLAKLYVRSWWTDIRTGGATPGLSLFDKDPDQPSTWDAFKSFFSSPPLEPDIDPLDADMDMDAYDTSGSGWEGAGHRPYQDERRRVDHPPVQGAQGEEWGRDAWETEGEDDIVESMIIFGLVCGVLGLVWLRGQWARWEEERRAREEAQRRQ